MTLTLILMRHAKSSWGNLTLDDFDRPLNGRGRAGACAVGSWLVEGGCAPDLVVTSGARRTVETWEQLAHLMPAGTPMQSDRILYNAGPEAILDVIGAQDVQSLMIISHNPGIADFAARIVAKRPDHKRFADYPSAATTVIAFEAPRWRDVRWQSGQVRDFTIPRDLI